MGQKTCSFECIKVVLFPSHFQTNYSLGRFSWNFSSFGQKTWFSCFYNCRIDPTVKTVRSRQVSNSHMEATHTIISGELWGHAPGLFTPNKQAHVIHRSTSLTIGLWQQVIDINQPMLVSLIWSFVHFPDHCSVWPCDFGLQLYATCTWPKGKETRVIRCICISRDQQWCK